jgi:hypothetical protein
MNCKQSHAPSYNELFILQCCINTFYFLLALDGSGGRDNSVGIAIRYGLDGPGIECQWGRDLPHPSRPALWPTQLPIQWVPGLSRG